MVGRPRDGHDNSCWARRLTRLWCSVSEFEALCANDGELAKLRTSIRDFLATDRAAFGWEPAVDSWLAKWVARLVMVTKTHKATIDDINGAVLSDADLSVLGSDVRRYREYARPVREEYASVSDEVFKPAGTSAYVVTRRVDLPYRTRARSMGGACPP